MDRRGEVGDEIDDIFSDLRSATIYGDDDISDYRGRMKALRGDIDFYDVPGGLDEMERLDGLLAEHGDRLAADAQAVRVREAGAANPSLQRDVDGDFRFDVNTFGAGMTGRGVRRPSWPRCPRTRTASACATSAPSRGT